MQVYSRVLIISYSCFSKTDSNGRTLAGFFKGYPKEKLAQFYMQSALPDFDVCENYFRVTDSQALRSFLKKRQMGGRVIRSEVELASHSVVSTKKKKRVQKTPITMLVRSMVWNSRKWWGESFNAWLNAFSPEMVVLQAGDSDFTLKLATDIAQMRGIPLVIYNSENYYFKDRNYMRGSGITSIFYPAFIKKFRKQFERTIEYASYSIYSCEGLKKVYEEKFHKNSAVIYTTSSLIPSDKKREPSVVPIISYLGNLGVGRHEPLMEIAQALYSINSEYRLDVYGKFPNEKVKKQMLACPGIQYKGFVSYEEVVAIMQGSDLLIHAENFNSFYIEDLKFAFSTKIADSLSCGSPLFFYAPQEVASTKYLLENEAAYVISDKEKLLEGLKNALENKEQREIILRNALNLAQENHNKEKNYKKFWSIIEKVCNESSAS